MLPPATPEAASNDNPSSARALDQFYTADELATHFVEVVDDILGLNGLQIIEPSAGTGSFLKFLPPGSKGYDLKPKFPGIENADFLQVEIEREGDKKILVIGNPPFGQNGKLARAFFNRAAIWADFIAMILPLSFRKPAMLDLLDQHFHRVHEELVPRDAFLLDDKPYHVPTVFQIWERRDERRERASGEPTHRDFEFTERELAHFTVRRIGANAGTVGFDMSVKKTSHYFIRAKRAGVAAVMKRIDFISVSDNVVGPRSISRPELVALYQAARAYLPGRSRTFRFYSGPPRERTRLYDRRRQMRGRVRLWHRRRRGSS